MKEALKKAYANAESCARFVTTEIELEEKLKNHRSAEFLRQMGQSLIKSGNGIYKLLTDEISSSLIRGRKSHKPLYHGDCYASTLHHLVAEVCFAAGKRWIELAEIGRAKALPPPFEGVFFVRLEAEYLAALATVEQAKPSQRKSGRSKSLEVAKRQEIVKDMPNVKVDKVQDEVERQTGIRPSAGTVRSDRSRLKKKRKS